MWVALNFKNVLDGRRFALTKSAAPATNLVGSSIRLIIRRIKYKAILQARDGAAW